MKLRTGILLSTLIGSLAATLIIYCISQSIILSAFQNLEEHDARTNALRVVGLLEKEREHLMSSCTEWASWDATSNCLRGAHWEFERRGLVVPNFVNLGIDDLVLLDTDGQIVLSRGFDAQNAEFTVPSPELLALVQTPQFRARAAAGASGIVTLQGETLLVAAHPIIAERSDEPSQGLLVIARLLNGTRVAEISEVLQLPLHLDRVDDPHLELDRQALLSDPDHILTSPDSADRLTSYAISSDIYGQPALVWSIPLTRLIRQQGQWAIHGMAATVAGIIAAFGAGLLCVVHNKMIRPLDRLSSELRLVGASGDLSQRVTAAGQDEFSALAREANQMLSRLEQSRDDLQESEHLWRSLVETIPDLIFRVSEWTSCPPASPLSGEAPLTAASIDVVSPLPWMDVADPVGLISAALRVLPSDCPQEWPPVIAFSYDNAGQRNTYEARLVAIDGHQMLGMIRDITIAQRNREALSHAMDELEERVAARTRELQVTNDQLRQEIAERQRAEAEKEHIHAELMQAQKMEAIGLLAGGVAHDFNNVLTTIQGYNEIALLDTPQDSPLHADLEQVAEACTRAAGLTRQLLLFSRRQPMKMAPVDLNTVIEGLFKMLRRLIGEDIAVELELEPALWPVEADAGRIEQIITNLVVNARDAMPQGGSLTIRTANIAAAHLPPDMPSPTSGLATCISIRDSGIGMDARVLAHCFEPFFTTKEAGKGTGMGLSVVYGVLQQHQGSAAIESQVGQGTTIHCYLPAVASPLVVDGPAPAGRPGRVSRSARVLLVEDDPGVRAFTARILEDSRYRVSVASTPMEAMALFLAHGQQFDLVITDVVLPGGGGLQLLDELLALRPELRIIVCSGYLDDRSQHDVLTARGFPYLAKPYTIDDLLGAIAAALG